MSCSMSAYDTKFSQPEFLENYLTIKFSFFSKSPHIFLYPLSKRANCGDVDTGINGKVRQEFQRLLENPTSYVQSDIQQRNSKCHYSPS